MIDRFGEEIEYDLHVELGVDLLDFFRGVHSWRKLYRLLDRLPPEGHYKAALATDYEFARRVAQAEFEQGITMPVGVEAQHDVPVLGYGPVIQKLDLIIDLLQYQRSAIFAAAGGKPPEVKPQPRPVTAIQQARQEIEFAQLNDVLALMLPPGSPTT